MNWRFTTAADEFLGENLIVVDAEFNGRRAMTTCSAAELDETVADLERRLKHEAEPEAI